MADSLYPVVVIGAGASGLFAAISAARVCPHAVLLLEKEARVGRKLMATGNGRCNLLNARAERPRFHGGGADIAMEALRAQPPDALRKLFDALGLTCREEAEGRIYPYSGQAGAVVDVLRGACERLGVRTETGAAVERIDRRADGFLLRLADGRSHRASRVILATGGKAAPALGSDGGGYALLRSLGHPITPLFPALVPLRVPADAIRGLKGVRVQAGLTLYAGKQPVRAEQGELLFTDSGLSGIAAMQLARAVQTAQDGGLPVSLSVQLMPPPAARGEVKKRAFLFAGEPMEQLFTGLLHKRLTLCLLRAAGIVAQAPISLEAAAPLAGLLSDWRLPVSGTLSFAQAQVTAGGAALDAFHPQTLESRLVPGLYACGELLDVDGDCGGYNLMWAWCSAEMAGRSAAQSLQRPPAPTEPMQEGAPS